MLFATRWIRQLDGQNHPRRRFWEERAGCQERNTPHLRRATQNPQRRAILNLGRQSVVAVPVKIRLRHSRSNRVCGSVHRIIRSQYMYLDRPDFLKELFSVSWQSQKSGGSARRSRPYEQFCQISISTGRDRQTILAHGRNINIHEARVALTIAAMCSIRSRLTPGSQAARSNPAKLVPSTEADPRRT